MARDVEFNLTASDKTGNALTAAARRFEEANKKIKTDQDKLGDDVRKGLLKAVDQVAPKLAAGLANAFSAAGPAVIPAIAGVAAAAAPFIGATVSAAVIGGVGIGGLVGGVVVAAKDPRATAAIDGLKQHIGEQLRHAAAPLVDETIIGIDRIQRAVDTIDFGQVFGDAAFNAGPIVEGIAVAIERIGDSIENLSAAAGPVMEELGAGLASVGAHLADGLNQLSDNGQGAAEALNALFATVNSGIDLTFNLVNALTELYEINHKIGADFLLQGFMKVLGVDVDDLDSSTRSLAATQEDMHQKFLDSVEPGLQYAEALAAAAQDALDLADANRTLFGTQVSVAQAMADATAKIKDNGKTVDKHTGQLNLNTQKGRDNAHALNTVADKLVANYQSYVKVNGVGATSERVADANRAAFVKLAEKAGLSARAASDLATKLGLIPGKKTTEIHASTHDAEARIAALKAQLNSVRSKTITVTVARRVTGSALSDSALNAALRKNFDTATSWSAAAGGGMSRTGGPTPVSVENSVTVNLDGRPFRTMTATTVRADRNREKFRAKVGTR